MTRILRSPFAYAVLGGVIVAGAFLALGVTGRRTAQPIIEQVPVDIEQTSHTSGPTPREIYERDAPAVVFVQAQVVQQVQSPFELTPQQVSSTSTGSGFLIDHEGHILTNYHVIAGADRHTGVAVQFGDNVSRQATVIGANQDDDLALLQVDMTGVPPVTPLVTGDSSTVRVGDPTEAIGNPFGLDRTLTSGIVSALQRQIQAPDGFTIDNVIQTDAPLNPGNSGGPLLDAAGRVIGINSQILTSGGSTGSIGIGFAVPINTARNLLPRLESTPDKVAYLGMRAAPSTAPGGGVVVQNTAAGGPAAAAGLRRGDVIKAIGGNRVTSMTDVQSVVGAHLPGQAVTVQAQRATRTQDFKVVLRARPAQARTP